MHSDGASMVDAFRDSAKAFLADMGGPTRLRQQRGTVPGFDRNVWQSIAEAGWTSILVPEDQGGLGLGLRELVAVVEEIGRRPLPEPFVAAAVQSTALLCALPAGALRDQLLGDVVSGKRLVGVAWQERAGELEAVAVQTRADAAGGRTVLTGTKQWVVPGAGADGWLVLAEGQQVFWVSRR